MSKKMKCVNSDGHDWDITIWDDGERRCEYCIHCSSERIIEYTPDEDRVPDTDPAAYPRCPRCGKRLVRGQCWDCEEN